MLISRTFRWLLLALALLTPLVTTYLLIERFSDIGLFGYIPTTSDKIMYWHQIATFREVGFNGGYYSIDEAPAPASFSRFGTKGPLFPAIYGMIARVTGWQPSTGLPINIAFVTLAVGIMLYATRPKIIQLIALIAFIASFWAMHLYLPTMMQEALHQAIAILLAPVFIMMTARRKVWSRRTFWLMVALILLASFIRGVTWALVLVPFFALDALNRGTFSLRSMVWAAIQASTLVIVAFIGFTRLSLPGSNFISTLPQASGLELFWHDIQINLTMFATVDKSPLENAQRYLMVFLVIVCGVSLIVMLRRWRGQALLVRGTWFAEALFHTLNLGGILAANFLLYDMHGWRDYRVMAPHVLLSALVLLFCHRYWLLALIIALNIGMYPQFRRAYPMSIPNDYPRYDERVDDFRAVFEQQLTYDPAQSNAWCNTLLLHNSQLLDSEIITVPPGIGLTVGFGPYPPEHRFLSQYLLIPQSHADSETYSRFERLGEVPSGVLFRNPDADCE
ncbi:MAG: hypothetical protein H7175_19180 [Burkholderiales bacterium]|nr:hypothetical protein [Anaerolineae bacterium]